MQEILVKSVFSKDSLPLYGWKMMVSDVQMFRVLNICADVLLTFDEEGMFITEFQ